MADITFKEWVAKNSKEYAKGANINVMRNNHMSELTDEDEVSLVDCQVVLIKYITYLEINGADVKLKMFNKVQACEALKNIAIKFFDKVEIDQTKKLAQAVVVDFINFLAGKMYFDYALYTRDLNE